MSESELNSYRFTSGNEPTDEMLAQIMREVAEDAKKSNDEAAKKNLEEMRRDMLKDQAEWKERLNKLKNGNS